jgi:clorobiocin biosynthesis protein Clo-hal
MNNFAVYGYFSGAEWKSTLSGTHAATTVFIASVPLGWIWYFPIGEDLMSVGFVTHRRHFREEIRGREPEALYREALDSCPEINPLLRHATLRDDILPQNKRVGVTQDWSSWAESPVGEGWAAAGDAAVFVDPILSSGVTLALQSGHRAAYTWLTARSRPELDREQLWRAYADYLRGEAFSFLQLARFFYANNRSAESWWWEAQRLLNARGKLELEPRQAFSLATAGFFPVPRAIGLEVVVPLIGKLAGGADLSGVFDDPGFDRADVALDATLIPLGAFSLAMRTEPNSKGNGFLDIYHDLTSDDSQLGHRLAALPSRISPELEPVVRAMQEPIVVSDLLEKALAVLGPTGRSASQIREVSIELIRRAVIKGFVRLDKHERSHVGQ